MQEEALVNFPNLPQKLHVHCALHASNYIYVIGGRVEHEDEFSSTDDVWRLNLQSRDLNWEKISSMNEKRHVMGAAIHYHDTIVVTGGSNESLETLRSVECYIAALNEWKTLSPMNQPRWGNALVSCDGCLYALGGNDGENLSSVERMRELKGTWENVQPMQKPRTWLAAVNCEGTMYVIGGKTGQATSTTSKTVEKYNSTLNVWKYVKT